MPLLAIFLIYLKVPLTQITGNSPSDEFFHYYEDQAKFSVTHHCFSFSYTMMHLTQGLGGV